VDALVSAGATLIGAYPGPAVLGPVKLDRGFVERKNNATMAIDPYMQVEIPAGGTVWTVDCHIIYSGADGAGFFKFSLSGPAGTEIDWYVPAYRNTANVELDHETSAQAPTRVAYTYGASKEHQAALAIHGMVYPGAPGKLGLWWSQDRRNATGTRVWNGSRLTLTRVS